jgi:hypothetical protein
MKKSTLQEFVVAFVRAHEWLEQLKNEEDTDTYNLNIAY